MEAKDTVMNREQIIISVCGDCPFEGRFSDEDCHACQRQLEGVAQAQAEISFKAGRQQGRIDTWDTAIKAAIDGARREVVEDITNEMSTAPMGLRLARFEEVLGKWQARLKEVTSEQGKQ